jgi:DNA-binding Lrp family transcriptional regulator
MPKAYVEIRTTAGWQAKVITALMNKRTFEEDNAIKDIDVIFGDYDVMVVIEHKDRERFYNAIGALARIAGVSSTNSRLAMEPEFVEKAFAE